MAPPAPVAAPYIGGDPAREYLQFFFGVLSRRRWFLLWFVAVVIGLATLVANEIKPRYAAETQMVLQASPGRSAASGIEALLGGGADMESDTEAAILTSRTLAERLVRTLHLDVVPFFTGSTPGSSEAEKVAGSALDWVMSWVPKSYRDALTPAAAEPTPNSKRLSRMYDIYFRNLTVTTGDRSRVLTIRFVADDPNLAATIANTLAQIYIDDQSERRSKSSSSETSMLDQRLAELRQNIEEAEKRIEAFQSKNGVVDASGITALQKQAAEYSQQLLAAQLRRADLDMRAKQLQQLASSGGTGMADSAAALESPNIQRLRDQEAAVTRQIADLSAQYRDDHPRMQQARAELNDVRAKIVDEMRRLVAAAANQAKLAQEQEAALQSKLEGLKQQVEAQTAGEGSIRLLEADLKTNSQIYATLLGRSQEASALQQGLGGPSVRIISPAVAADHPFFPNKPVLIIAAAAVGAMIGILLAFILELLDVGFRTRQQIEGLTGLETVASIPALGRLVRARRLSDLRHVLREQPAFAEAVRYVRVSLSLAPDGKSPVRRLLVTSSLPGEGKTFTARALAVTFALGGKHVVTVDCDLRQKPRRWARQTDTGKRAGLADLLVGAADIDSVIGIDPATGLHHIDCGDTQTLTDAPIMLESPQMKQLLRTLADRYDMVIVDTPPVRLFPDALILQQEVDKVLFLVRWAKTRREVALDALKSIVQSGCFDPVVGLTLVDPKHTQRFEYMGRLPQRYFKKYPVHREVA
ncbi:MAG TPA: polysaccharide biosynthesis tyrosine autokinase [Alphaproteobacteria bacterium]|nr:polysaccharide biosynthesis tyrosine autokinase [Alphaproteobacteria bacterium]